HRDHAGHPVLYSGGKPWRCRRIGARGWAGRRLLGYRGSLRSFGRRRPASPASQRLVSRLHFSFLRFVLLPENAHVRRFPAFFSFLRFVFLPENARLRPKISRPSFCSPSFPLSRKGWGFCHDTGRPRFSTPALSCCAGGGGSV